MNYMKLRFDFKFRNRYFANLMKRTSFDFSDSSNNALLGQFGRNVAIVHECVDIISFFSCYMVTEGLTRYIELQSNFSNHLVSVLSKISLSISELTSCSEVFKLEFQFGIVT